VWIIAGTDSLGRGEPRRGGGKMGLFSDMVICVALSAVAAQAGQVSPAAAAIAVSCPIGPDCTIIGPGLIVDRQGTTGFTLISSDEVNGLPKTALLLSPVRELAPPYLRIIDSAQWRVRCPLPHNCYGQVIMAVRSADRRRQVASATWQDISAPYAEPVQLKRYYQWQVTLTVPAGRPAPVVDSIQMLTVPADEAASTRAGSVFSRLARVWMLTLLLPVMLWLFNLLIARLFAGPDRRRS